MKTHDYPPTPSSAVPEAVGKPDPLEKGGLRVRLLRSHMLFSALTALLVALTAFYYLQDKLMDNARERLHLALRCRVNAVEQALERGRTVTRMVAGHLGLAKALVRYESGEISEAESLKRLDRLVRESLGACDGLCRVEVRNTKDELMASVGASDDDDFGAFTPPCPRYPGEVAVGQPAYRGPSPVITFAAQVPRPGPSPAVDGDDPAGSILLRLRLPKNLERITTGPNLGRTGKIYLGTRREDRVMVHPIAPEKALALPDTTASSKGVVTPDEADSEPVFASKVIPDPSIPDDGAGRNDWRPMALNRESRLVNTEDPDGIDVLAAFEPVHGADWGLVLTLDLAELRAPVLSAALLILVSTALLVSISLVLALKKLGPMADLLVLWTRELETTVARRTEELERSEAMYHLLTESLADGEVILQDGKILFANRAFRNLVGLEDFAYEGAFLKEWIAPEDSELLAKRSRMRSMNMNPEPRFSLKLLDRREKLVQLEVVEKRIEYGGREAWLLSMRDLSAIKRLHLYESVLPTCSVCKAVRDDSKAKRGEGEWMPLDRYIMRHAHTRLSHTYCPECKTEVLRAHNLA